MSNHSAATSETIAIVVARGLCTSCGACSAVCPELAIDMRMSPAGLLEAVIDQTKCTRCGLCIRVCPGQHLELCPDVAEYGIRGRVRAAFLGRANDPQLLRHGQSGGATAALLASLLDSRRVNKVACVSSESATGSGTVPTPRVIDSAEGLHGCQGSHYQPIAALTALRDCDYDDRIALVGLPCQIHGLSKVELLPAKRRPQTVCGIGLICDRTLMGIAPDLLAADAGIPSGRVAGIGWRDTLRSGWPGELSFRLKSGETVYAPSSLRHALKDYVTPPRCRVCFDKCNILSDVTVGDPWGITTDPIGATVLLARTSVGEELLMAAAESGHLSLESIDPQAVFSGQKMEERGAYIAGYRHAWRALGGTVPTVTGLDLDSAEKSLDRAQLRLFKKRLKTGIHVARAKSRRSAITRVRLLRAPSRITTSLRSIARRVLRR